MNATRSSVAITSPIQCRGQFIYESYVIINILHKQIIVQYIASHIQCQSRLRGNYLPIKILILINTIVIRNKILYLLY